MAAQVYLSTKGMLQLIAACLMNIKIEEGESSISVLVTKGEEILFNRELTHKEIVDYMNKFRKHPFRFPEHIKLLYRVWAIRIMMVELKKENKLPDMPGINIEGFDHYIINR